MALDERFRDIPGVNFSDAKHKIVTAITDILIPEVHLVGDSRNNLAEMQRIKQQGDPTETLPRHISNIDAGAIYKMYVDNGYSKIANDSVYILGNRLNKNIFRSLTDAYPHISVWPPTEDAVTEEEIEQKGAMNELAEKAAKQVLERGGNLVIFAQGGREKGETFKPFHTGSGGYLSMKRDIAVFPIALDETDQVLVPAPKGWDRVPHVHSPIMHVGAPISTAFLRSEYARGTVAEVYKQRLGYVHERLIEGQAQIAEYQEQIRLYTE